MSEQHLIAHRPYTNKHPSNIPASSLLRVSLIMNSLHPFLRLHPSQSAMPSSDPVQNTLPAAKPVVAGADFDDFLFSSCDGRGVQPRF